MNTLAALNLNNNQLQVLLTGRLGDGCLYQPKSCKSTAVYSTNSIHKEYVSYKRDLLGELVSHGIDEYINQGYSNSIMYRLSTRSSSDIYTIKNLSLSEVLQNLDELGIALWFYDDGSLHKTKLFYNLNTQKFTKEIQYDLLVPTLNRFGIIAKPTIENKRDRSYWYLRISRYEGSDIISEILSKYYVDCYRYKIWSSETRDNWNKLKDYLKRTNNLDKSIRFKANILKKIEQKKL